MGISEPGKNVPSASVRGVFSRRRDLVYGCGFSVFSCCKTGKLTSRVLNEVGFPLILLTIVVAL